MFEGIVRLGKCMSALIWLYAMAALVRILPETALLLDVSGKFSAIHYQLLALAIVLGVMPAVKDGRIRWVAAPVVLLLLTLVFDAG